MSRIPSKYFLNLRNHWLWKWFFQIQKNHQFFQMFLLLQKVKISTAQADMIIIGFQKITKITTTTTNTHTYTYTTTTPPKTKKILEKKEQKHTYTNTHDYENIYLQIYACSIAKDKTPLKNRNQALKLPNRKTILNKRHKKIINIYILEHACTYSSYDYTNTTIQTNTQTPTSSSL